MSDRNSTVMRLATSCMTAPLPNCASGPARLMSETTSTRVAPGVRPSLRRYVRSEFHGDAVGNFLHDRALAELRQRSGKVDVGNDVHAGRAWRAALAQTICQIGIPR